MGKIYIDTNLFIYFLEFNQHFSEKAKRIIGDLYNKQVSIVTSELTIAECLVKPIQRKNTGLVSIYTEFFQSRENFFVVPVSKNILLQALHLLP